MLNTTHIEEYLREVKAFAKRVGLEEQLESRLQYLAQYANHGDTDKTECVLGKDFAPYSFTFTMRYRARSYSLHLHECDVCGGDIKSEKSYHGHRCFLRDGTASGQCGGTLRVVGVEHKTTDGGYWFSGGLIFHGPHDGGNNGGAPTYSVSLTPEHGWSIHT